MTRGTAGPEEWSPSGQADVKISEGKFFLGGEVTYGGVSAAEGKLMNVRMVNCVFEDLNPSSCPRGFCPEANTDAFLATVAEYRSCGVLAFTISLQGGFPGYEGARNSAFSADGSLRDGYMNRVDRIIQACDACGMAVILGLYYQRQNQTLADEDAVRAGAANAANWVASRGYRNVLIEIANEYPHKGFTHALLRTPEGIAELMNVVRKTQPGIPVSASGYGDAVVHDEAARAADFVLLHGNGVNARTMVEGTEKFLRSEKPVVFNEDDKHGEEAAAACEAVFKAGGSWGYMNKEVNQYYLFVWGIEPGEDRVVYDKIAELTGSG